MLIDFTVENFRSIKEPVTLSMVAQSKTTGKPSTRAGVKPDDEIAKPYAIGNRDIEVLPAAGIFGANASGKSNVLFALGFLLRLMDMGLNDAQGPYGPLSQFMLDELSSTQPTRFEIRVATGPVIYSYSIALTADRITQEKLEYLFPQPNQTRLLFERNWEPTDGKYDWDNGPSFKGPHVKLESTLQAQVPFLSLLTSSFDVPSVQPLSNWLIHLLPGASPNHEARLQLATEPLLFEQPDLLERVVKLVTRFDTGLSDIKMSRPAYERLSRMLRASDYEFTAVHLAGSQAVTWRFDTESTGTQKLFWLSVAVLLAIDFGTPLLVDDFGSNLHPEITETIVRMFQNERLNPKRAQLIFNSHDYTLMHGNLMRRDQIWFTQKQKDGSTELYPLTDFHPRNDLVIDKAYIDGRFRAVPILPAEEDLFPNEGLVG